MSVGGAEASQTTRQTFRWHPPWVIVLILAGVLIWVIVALILTKTMVVYAPVCDRHRRYWFGRTVLIWLLVLAGIAAVFAGIFALIAFEKDPQLKDIGTWALPLGILTLLVCWIAAAVVQSLSIRPKEITDEDIQLTHVDPDFVAALKDQRRADRADRERRPRYRTADD